ncbi:MAG: dGTPase [Acinetobacter sp.]|uniref:dGTPase n=1 Tax=Acinetobacter sp. TaxID=472 RepID=UPI002FCC88D3
MSITQEQVNTFFSYIKPDRLKYPERKDGSLLEAAESDRGRVINSAAFRRLQQKAQVFPLEPNASVRSRLTHSFEVSQIGRYIAQSIIKEFEASSLTLPDYEHKIAFVSTVETACLLHDIGNPPFGHLGEAAIQEWFTNLTRDFDKKTDNIPSSDEIRNFIKTDLVKFDGNPQGFRIVRLLSNSQYDKYGLNLTNSLLLSIVKYPCTLSTMEKNGYSKIGLFDKCYETYKQACDSLEWYEGKPFPYMQIMDVADEIAYSMSDLEDAIEKNIISEKALLKVFSDYCFKPKSNESSIDITTIFKSKTEDNFSDQSFIEFKTSIIHNAVKEVAHNYVIHLAEIIQGEPVKLLNASSSEVAKLLKKVKDYAISNIYSHESAEKIELAGRNIIQGLLRHYEILLRLPYNKFKALLDGKDENGATPRKLALDFELRLFHRLPKTHIDKYRISVTHNQENELIYRAHLIVDYISGMTDDFALEMYQLLEGIRIQ